MSRFLSNAIIAMSRGTLPKVVPMLEQLSQFLSQLEPLKIIKSKDYSSMFQERKTNNFLGGINLALDLSHARLLPLITNLEICKPLGKKMGI